jgi:hypothetical protein
MIFGVMRQAILILVLWIGLPVGGGAGSDAVHPSWDLGVLMNERATVPGGRATFEEARTLRVMRAPMEISGELIYQAPDYLRKTVFQPMFEEMEVVGKRLYLADRESRRRFHVDQHPVLAAVVAAIRGTLSGDLSAIEEHFRHSFSGTLALWHLDLTPHSFDVAEHLEKVTIEGEGRQLLKVETRYANGDVSLMRMQTVE